MMSDNQLSVQKYSHDATVFAAAGIYYDFGMSCSLYHDHQEDSEREGLTIDLFVTDNSTPVKAWGIAFESTDSITENQAQCQWLGYSKAFDYWYLAVPLQTKTSTIHLLEKLNIRNCSLITWQEADNEKFSFRGLPGLPSGSHEKKSMYSNYKRVIQTRDETFDEHND